MKNVADYFDPVNLLQKIVEMWLTFIADSCE